MRSERSFRHSAAGLRRAMIPITVAFVALGSPVAGTANAAHSFLFSANPKTHQAMHGDYIPKKRNASGSSWSLVPTANVSGSSPNSLDGVSCVSSKLCVAVGTFLSDATGAVQSLIESSTGGKWSLMPTPTDVGGGNYNYINAVSCASPRSCTAVGNYVQSVKSSQGFTSVRKTLILSWNGKKWSAVASPNRKSGDNILQGVSCTSATSCVAAGYNSNASTNLTHTLVESWNGKRWATVPSPNVPGANNFLDSVSCVSAKFCVVTGTDLVDQNNVFTNETLVESWNGSKWSMVSMPPPAQESQGAALQTVSCVSPTFCVAGGWVRKPVSGHGVPSQTLVERWDGKKWSVVRSPDIAAAADTLAGISCTSDNACRAVGSYNTSFAGCQGSPAAGCGWLAESWDGKKWAMAKSSSSAGSYLAAISCSGSSCAAAGSSGSPGFGLRYHTLILTWHGSLSTVPSPNRPAIGDALNATSCASRRFCMAVGYYTNANLRYDLIENWNGVRWSVSPRGSEGVLSDVSCVSSSFCVAVTNLALASQGTPAGTLIYRWSGHGWSGMSAPTAGTAGGDFLSGVSCVSTHACQAVGYYFDTDGLYHPLDESWNGKSWSLEQAPEANTFNWNVFSAVSCTQSDHCIAVGDYVDSENISQQLAELWNGSKWSIMTTAVSNEQSSLGTLSCTSARFCIAMGSAGSSEVTQLWNGKTWLPASGATYGGTGLSCVSSKFCITVGTSQVSGGPLGIEEKTQSAAWNGHRWTLLSTPDDGAQGNELLGVSCLGSGACMAVGRYFAGPDYRTLSERYG